MAKQKHGRPRPRPRPPQPSALQACPSISVLSLLATIAAGSQTVDGTPLPLPTPPPSFLCPYIEHTLPPASTSSASSSLPTYGGTAEAQVADKYVQGDDGRWRKTDEWTLFGSTCCSTSDSDLTAETSQSTLPLPTSQAELDSVLPAGWSAASTSSDRTDTIIILSLAIILAVSICVFMVGCIFWRRRRKKRACKEKSVNDVELKTRHKANVDDPSEDGDVEREARGKLHIWAKASARWRSNIRHSARRRKNRRHVVSTGRLSRPQSPILTQAREVSVHPSSPPSSRRHSIPSISEDSHAATTHSPENPFIQLLPSPVSSSQHIISSPPAYMSPTQQIRPATEDCLQEISHINSGGDTSRRKSLLFDPHDFPPAVENEDISYQPSYAGHVAIDDKAHLARLAGLASAPPANEESTGQSSLAVHESAPEWHDDPEELDFPSTITTPVTSPFEVGISVFPSPPSKSVFSSRYFDGHSYLEDITSLDPTTLPSMPPYEAGPSAVPFEEVPQASAPPLSDDDQAFECWESTAPEAFVSGCDTHIPSSPSQSDRSCACENGTLPIYQP